MSEQKATMPHKLTLDEKQKLSMTGVTEVVRFDDEVVVLHTELGVLTVHGNDLKLKTLSLEGGQVAINGSIQALIYEAAHAKRTGWRRLIP